VTFAHLQPVLETLEYLVKETKVWTEITTLLIPGQNDGDAELEKLCAWVAEKLGPEVPLHFTAFHPDFKMTDVPATPVETVRRARRIGLAAGLRHVYTGNVHDREGDVTRCAGCQTPLIERDWYEVLAYRLTPEGACPSCARPLAGRFAGGAGSWGRRRLRVSI
jgi:pyruvate formate lyase activating enzyme